VLNPVINHLSYVVYPAEKKGSRAELSNLSKHMRERS
jgi:hypothetical protein